MTRPASSAALSLVSNVPSATRHIPIIVLSAHAMTNDRDMALAAGGDDFDTKPVRFEQLLGKIESLLPKAVIE
jgi:CheY-like chemotaxis protein